MSMNMPRNRSRAVDTSKAFENVEVTDELLRRNAHSGQSGDQKKKCRHCDA